MTFRTELIEAGAQRLMGRHRNGSSTYVGTIEDARNDTAAALDAMLAYRTTDECPTCGGTGRVRIIAPCCEEESRVHDHGTSPCPDCTDGRVPRDSPRLAVVDEYEWGIVPTFILAPDLPEGTS